MSQPKKDFLKRGNSNLTLLQGCQVWSKNAASFSTQFLSMSGKTASCSSSMLSRFAVGSFGSWSSALLTGNSAATCRSLPVQSATPLVEQIRTKVRYSRNRGKPQTVHAVPERFYRLNWGIWIRTRAGRKKKLWKKTPERKHRLRQHVFCNRTQSKLLDKMVTDFWKRPKYWVNDPYEHYHKRQNFDRYFPERTRSFYP